MNWIAICLVAAFIQTLRNSNQKILKDSLPNEMVAWSRFLFALPFSIIYVYALTFFGYELPATNFNFWLFCFIAGIAQIIGNLMLIALFSRRNFAMGITYSKIEAIGSAILGVILFQDYISIYGVIAVILGFVGIFIISIVETHLNPLKLIKSAINKSMLLGIGCGLFYALAGVLIRQASLSLESDSIMMRAAFTLNSIIAIQAVLLGAFVFYKYSNVVNSLKNSLLLCVKIGFYGTVASIFWFTAFTITTAAYVTVVSQAEVLFSLLLSHKVFKEKISTLEVIGLIILLLSIVLLVFV